MPTAVDRIKEDLIAVVVSLAEKRLEGARAAQAKTFVLGLYQNVPPGDLLDLRADHLYAAALSLLSFAQQRTPGQPSLRVFTPTLDVHGWQSPHTVIEIINDDMPFLVDSVLAELSRQHADVQLLIHPVFEVQRSEQGGIVALSVLSAASDTPRESMMQIRVRARDAEQRAEIERRISTVLSDVRVAVQDFPHMVQQSKDLVQRLRAFAVSNPQAEVLEVAAFLEWLGDGHFAFLGTRTLAYEPPAERHFSIRPRPSTGLGILSDPSREVFEHYEAASDGEIIRIVKANERSTIHRPVHFDAILVTDIFSNVEQGQRSSYLFIGLFSLSAYARNTASIPLLRHKVESVVLRSGLTTGGHDQKVLRYILETYPRDELFQITESELLRIALGILYLQDRQRVGLFVRRDPFGRFVSCLVYLPRDRMDTSLRLRIQAILADAFNGSVSAFYTRLGDEPLARLHLILKTLPGQPFVTDYAPIERKLIDVTRSWQDRIQTALIHELGEERGTRLATHYAEAFPAAYRETYDELVAVHDIGCFEEAIKSGEMALQLFHKVEAEAHQLALKVFVAKGNTALSDVLPMLENMGLRVIGEVPYEVRPAHVDHALRMHDFTLVTEDKVAVELARVKDSFAEVLSSVWRGTMGNDGFNKLVLHAGLSAREVKLLRAYSRYLRQGQAPFSLEYLQQTLKRNAEVTRLLVAMFVAKFKPGDEHGGNDLEARHARIAPLRDELLRKLDAVTSLDEDRILRSYVGAVDATVRTNFYQRGADGEFKEYVSFKLDSKRVPDLPLPKPFREIFVFSPRVEGVHLRFGHVARGGLRWSDRQEDFRTEVLGLVRAQQVKNAVIVPVGSKGGFVLKHPPPPEAGRDALLSEGIACYRTFVSGLLDLTDNRVGDAVQTPPDVVAHDEADPYLVVAADKGTATFSDIANQVSEQYGFWLGDAFASGGSAGYDHKKMAITAKGAWESVKRHFREMGKDIQSQPFTCCGVGDMSGDVFGNGLLLSKQTKLVAAFNHQHIFLDPDPDPARSWVERQRLFDLPRSTWADYDRTLLSNGGAIFERKSKSLTISAEVRALLGIAQDTVTPNQLISSILKAEVELIFFGGIGTYVKARSESHADVGDRANDPLRVHGVDLRAQVIGEGANLGMTQRGRIEFASKGGRCNTDFIDNSAGVDCSDHEVNIKILLSEVERAGELTRKQRNDLLRTMTSDVAELVLTDNYLQSQVLSATEHLGGRMTDRLARFMRSLERAGFLDCALEALPDEETLNDRVKRGLGFTRPELCVLLSYSKNYLYQSLLSSSLPDDPYLESDLLRYFPVALRERFREPIGRHRLRREIIATVITNEMVNRVGFGFVHEATEKSGLRSGDAAKAYVVAREAFKMPSLWAAVEDLDNQVPAELQYTLLLEAGRCITSFTVWLLRAHGQHIDIAKLIDVYTRGASELGEHLYTYLPEEARAVVQQQANTWIGAGVPAELAKQIASLPMLVPMGDIVQVAGQQNSSVQDVARLYFELGKQFGFSWLRQLAARLPAVRAWDKQAVSAVIDDLYAAQKDLVLAMHRSSNGTLEPAELIRTWSAEREPQLNRHQQLLHELGSTQTVDLAMLAVANRQLKALIST